MVKIRDIIIEEKRYGKTHYRIDMTAKELAEKLTQKQLNHLSSLGFAGDEFKKITLALTMKKFDGD